MNEYQELFRGLLAPLVSLVAGWLLKDVLLGLYRQRREEVREEQLFRLREFYSPLFFWTGVSFFVHDEASRERCIRHLGDLLQKAAPLVKHEHFFVFSRLFEHLCGQKVTPPSPKQVNKARDWVYTQIELLNFSLFTSSDDYDLRTELDTLRPIKRLLRLGLSGVIQLVVWASLAVLIYALILVTSGNYWALGFVVLLVVALIVGELRRRAFLAKEMNKRMSS